MSRHDQLPNAVAVGAKASMFVASIVVLCILTVGFVLAITLLRPDEDNSSLIVTVVGIVVPVITGLLAGAVQQVHLAVNSRLTQLLELTEQSSRAKGKLDARDQTSEHPP